MQFLVRLLLIYLVVGAASKKRRHSREISLGYSGFRCEICKKSTQVASKLFSATKKKIGAGGTAGGALSKEEFLRPPRNSSYDPPAYNTSRLIMGGNH